MNITTADYTVLTNYDNSYAAEVIAIESTTTPLGKLKILQIACEAIFYGVLALWYASNALVETATNRLYSALFGKIAKATLMVSSTHILLLDSLIDRLNKNMARKEAKQAQIGSPLFQKTKESLHMMKIDADLLWNRTKAVKQFSQIKTELDDHLSKNQNLPLFKIPKEMFSHVMDYVDGPTFDRLSSTCKSFQNLLQKPEILAKRLEKIDEYSDVSNEKLLDYIVHSNSR